jgi:hypothetical protein
MIDVVFRPDRRPDGEVIFRLHLDPQGVLEREGAEDPALELPDELPSAHLGRFVDRLEDPLEWARALAAQYVAAPLVASVESPALAEVPAVPPEPPAVPPEPPPVPEEPEPIAAPSAQAELPASRARSGSAALALLVTLFILAEPLAATQLLVARPLAWAVSAAEFLAALGVFVLLRRLFGRDRGARAESPAAPAGGAEDRADGPDQDASGDRGFPRRRGA